MHICAATLLAPGPVTHPHSIRTPCCIVGDCQIGVLAELFQWKGDVAPSLSGWSAAERHHVGRELSGVLLYLIRIADVCGVDLGRAALDKLTNQEAL